MKKSIGRIMVATACATLGIGALAGCSDDDDTTAQHTATTTNTADIVPCGTNDDALAAIDTALGAHKGTPVSLDRSDDHDQWEIEVANANKLYEILISCDGKTVINADNDVDTLDADDVAIIDAITVTMADAITKVAPDNGYIDEVEIEDDSVWELEFDDDHGNDLDKKYLVDIQTGDVTTKND